MESDEISERYIAPCFVNGLEAYDGKVNLEFDENLISNEYVVKLCLDYEVKKGRNLVKKELIVALKGELYFVTFIINPKDDDSEPGKAVSFLGSLPVLLKQVKWKPDYKGSYTKEEEATGQWRMEIRITDPYGNIYLLQEHTTEKPNCHDPNAQDNRKQWKRCCFHKFTTSSYYGKDVSEMLSLAWVIAKWKKKKGARTQKESQICCGQFISKLARKCRVLTEDVVRSLSDPIYCRDLDTTTLRDLIVSDGKLIPEDPQPGVPRVGIHRPLRASMQDLYDRMGRMEIRQEEIKHMEYRQLYC
nr:hypothetical protein [Tanacetum cinerariifolium]